MSLYFPGMIVGVILLQTTIFAPTLFNTLNEKSAGKLIRALFPKFFLVISVLGGCSLAAFLQSGEATIWQIGIAVSSICFPLICRSMIPRTNRARDEGDEKTFDRLHRFSVILTVLVLVANLALPMLPQAN